MRRWFADVRGSCRDESHNVPHAMWSAKRAVVYIHSKYASLTLL